MRSNKQIKRFLKNIRFTDLEWDQMQEDILEKELSKLIICAKYNLKPAQYKAFKKYLYGN